MARDAGAATAKNEINEFYVKSKALFALML
jgi:hypothetical protein